ncbi:hypothetical protein LAH08_03068 [Micromonospora noduli]|uniref:Uncharacterized protein n=1 Tax=Micromonospora noduli TaxID=709876 RepID=A0A328N9L7_9ACTN|nr:hypothetical protein LAH08_03068 [Micromonospora noduli]
MTGVCPRRAHVLATGGRMTWPASAWKQIQAPCAAANLLPTATARDASWRSLPDCVRPPDEWNLLAVPDAMQQIGHTAQRVGDAETTLDHLGHPREGPAGIVPTVQDRTFIEHLGQLFQLADGEFAVRTARPGRRQSLRSASSPPPPPQTHRLLRNPQLRSDLRGRYRPLELDAAWIRTFSRRTRAAAFMPPPAGYLIPPAYRTHRPRSRRHADGRQPFNFCSAAVRYHREQTAQRPPFGRSTCGLREFSESGPRVKLVATPSGRAEPHPNAQDSAGRPGLAPVEGTAGVGFRTGLLAVGSARTLTIKIEIEPYGSRSDTAFVAHFALDTDRSVVPNKSTVRPTKVFAASDPEGRRGVGGISG